MVIFRTGLGAGLVYLVTMAGGLAPDWFYVLAIASFLFAAFAALALLERLIIALRCRRKHPRERIEYKVQRNWEKVQAAKVQEITRQRGEKL